MIERLNEIGTLNICFDLFQILLSSEGKRAWKFIVKRIRYPHSFKRVIKENY